MTYCLGMIVQEGIVGIADSRLTSGTEIISAKKLSIYQQGQGSLFMMTSGLRSVRDKTLTYFEEEMASRSEPFDRLFKAVNAIAGHVRQVSREDRPALVESGFKFDFHALVGGQLAHDREHLLYMVYPEGNWVEVGKGTPYQIIGSAAYGKPVLDRTLQYQDSLRFALKVGCLSFDSTRISAADVDYPIDVVIYAKNSYQITEYRYSKDDLAPISDWWQDRLRNSVRDLPAEWIDRVFMNVLPAAETRSEGA
ncbi:MAG TPA: peptidase, partial [Terriglobia bacterium]